MYLDVCEKTNVEAAPREQFEKAVDIIIAGEINQRQNESLKGTDPADTTYLASRVAGTGQPQVPSVIRHCGQCFAEIWIDATNLQMAEASKAIICTVCIPEVSGKPFDQILQETIRRIYP